MIQHQKIWLPNGEKHILEHLDRGPIIDGKGTYQYMKLDLAMNETKSWKRAVDVGGHVGLWAMHLVKRFRHVDAFEPVAEHRNCFIRNMDPDQSNWFLHPVALGNKTGEATVVRHKGDSGDSWLKPNEGLKAGLTRTETAYEDEKVQVRTLDSYRYDDVSFIKVDCEGFELYVLEGAVATIKKCRPTIIVEQKPGRADKYGLGQTDALPFLENLGMKRRAVISGDYIMGWS